MSTLHHAPSEIISIEAVATTPPADTFAVLRAARQEAVATADPERIIALLQLHGARVVQAALDNPACDDETLRAASAASEGAPELLRAVRTAERARSVRHRHAADLNAEEAIAAAGDRSRPSMDLRILHQRFRRRLTVAMALVGNPNTPDDIVERLEREGAPMVRRAARLRLGRTKTGVDLRRAEAARRAVTL